MRNRVLLAVMALYAVGCASGGQTSKPASGQPPYLPAITSQLEADQLRTELEEAYAQILSRSAIETPGMPHADIDAAASMTIPDHRTIQSAVRLFSVDLKERIQRSFLRSSEYKALIDRELERQNLPKGLAYLPLIESGYVPTLTSRAGAHGLWQFMPPTAREYGMRVDWWLDERADPEISTRAAIRYLKDLHRMFGDWPLALAAYNCGPGRVRRTMEASGAKTFWELVDKGLLPKETRGYVPTFYATIIIASDPQSYGFELGEPRERDLRGVEVAGPVSLAHIAEAIGLDETQLQTLNPALRRGVVPPGRGIVHVPSKAAATLAAYADTLHQGDAHLQYATFTLRKGDSVERLARAVNTKPETLLAMNNVKSPASLRAGDPIVLPVRARELGTLLAHSEHKDVFYAVRKGDTLFSIAKQNGLTVSELRELNALPSDSILSIGQKLRINAPNSLTAGGM
ncbi:MAG TPA: transglycosylase SLT domain-containing protein [Thermoanaerobaculia bacterium]